MNKWLMNAIFINWLKIYALSLVESLRAFSFYFLINLFLIKITSIRLIGKPI